MKQITIYDLLPLLRKGWVMMGSSGRWYWTKYKPTKSIRRGGWLGGSRNNHILLPLSTGFNIAPFDGDWKDSLMECGK